MLYVTLIYALMSGKLVICKFYGKRVGRKIINTSVANIFFHVHVLGVKIPTRCWKSNNLHINIAINHYFLDCIVNDLSKLTTVSQVHILNHAKSYVDVEQTLQIMSIYSVKTRTTNADVLTITH